MTLVLAIRCSEGIVLASDGQVTADTAGQPTKAASRKLFDVGGRLAWGAAGSAGLQQTLEAELAGLNGHMRDAESLRQRLAAIVIPIQQQALARYVPHPGSDPPDLSCIFCWCDGDAWRILEIPRTGSDHQFHERYCAIGSGDIFAKFAMASVAHLDTSELALEHAKMVAFKAIADAIQVAAVFLGPPIQMFAVTAAGARLVPPEEVEGGLADSVDLWKERQRETLGPLVAPPRLRPRCELYEYHHSIRGG
jgi:20S proteasome alpha/beta subunit